MAQVVACQSAGHGIAQADIDAAFAMSARSAGQVQKLDYLHEVEMHLSLHERRACS